MTSRNKSHKQYFVMSLVLGLALVGALALAQQQDNNLINDGINVARDYTDNKQWDYAAREWRLILKQDPGNITANLGLSEVLTKVGLQDEAVRVLETAWTGKKDLSIGLALSDAYTQQKHPEKSATLLKTLLEQNPANSDVFRALQQTTMSLPPVQKEDVEKLLSDKAEEAKKKGEEAIKAGRYADALPYYAIRFINAPAVTEANDFSVVMFLSGNRSGAYQRLKQLIASTDSHCEIKANGAVAALSLGNEKEAQKMMEDVIARCDNPALKPQLYNDLGFIYEADKKWVKAQTAYEHALALNPTLHKAQINLGYAYQRARTYPEAVELYQRLLTSSPDNADLWNELGFTYELMGNFKLAEPAYKKAIALNPMFHNAYYNLGVLYKKQNRMKEADQLLHQLSQLELAQLEKGNTDELTSRQSPLFDYIDLFFANPVL
jgi:tetratricopeptide (TPR) repeat protein